MSSHHFVREGQEPALIIACEDPSANMLFDQLAAWNPVVISFDDVLPHLQAAGISCDHVLVSSRTETWEDILHGYGSVHECPIDKRPEKIAEILASYDCRSARYLTSTELDFTNWEKMAEEFEISVLTPSMHWVYVRQGNYKKWLPAGVRVSIHGSGECRLNDKVIEEQEIHTDTDAFYHATSNSSFWWGELLAH